MIVSVFITFYLFISTLVDAQDAIEASPNNYLSWKHDYKTQKDSEGKTKPAKISRFDIILLFKGEGQNLPKVRHQMMVSPEESETKTFKIKILNIFKDEPKRGNFEVFIQAFDIYGTPSNLSDGFLIHYDPPKPSPPFELTILGTPVQ